MAYNEELADRLREALLAVPRVVEKRMFRGIAFLVGGKMCINVGDDELMIRIDPILHDELVEKPGCRSMKMKGKTLKGYVLVNADGRKTKKDFDYWVSLALDFNKRAKVSKKKR